jgi:AraC-like DNA-binding protein
VSEYGCQASLSAGTATSTAKAHIVFEDRLSDSPVLERVWRCHSERPGPFLSVAATNFEMCITRLRGKVLMTLRGPEMYATAGDCPSEGEWLGIRFKPGTFMPRIPPASLRNRQDLNLPDASSRSFWLNGSAWEYPDFENAEVFVKRLLRSGLIASDPIVDEVLHEQPASLSLRSTQRHFLRATGMTYTSFRQIERARYATNLLRQSVSILDTVHLAGYFDQAHLTRSLRHLIGETPVQVRRGDRQLSFLYKNERPR